MCAPMGVCECECVCVCGCVFGCVGECKFSNTYEWCCKYHSRLAYNLLNNYLYIYTHIV